MIEAPETMEDALKIVLKLTGISLDLENRMKLIQDELVTIHNRLETLEVVKGKHADDDETLEFAIEEIAEAASEIGLIISLSPGQFEEFKAKAIAANRDD